MARRAAIALHVALSALGVVLYVLFVIPRWWVLTGDFPVTLGAVGRIAAGIPIAAAAVPVVLNLQRAVKPGSGTPELALRLRAWSAALHVLAGALILITAIAEFWLPLSSFGPWLFAVYGAAGAIAILAIAAFYLSFAAEKPPKPPKPPKPAKAKKVKKAEKADTVAETGVKKGRKSLKRIRKGADAEAESPDPEAGPETDAEADAVEEPVEGPVREPSAGTGTETETETETAEAATTADSGATATGPSESDVARTGAGLRNKRPSGKARQRLRR